MKNAKWEMDIKFAIQLGCQFVEARRGGEQCVYGCKRCSLFFRFGLRRMCHVPGFQVRFPFPLEPRAGPARL